MTDVGTARRPGGRVGGVLQGAVGALLVIVIGAPIALSSQDLLGWARSTTGLGLSAWWPVLVICALDAAAAVCVLFSVYCSWRGEPAGVFGLLVWCFAAGSAVANYRHNDHNGRPLDAIWFFPAMSLAGPVLLEVVLRRLRRWAQREIGRRGRSTPAFGWRRWTPGLGAFRDTYGAYRTALLCDIDTVEEAVAAYHTLCPTGSLHVVTALRQRHHDHAAGPTHPTSATGAGGSPAGRLTGRSHTPNGDTRRTTPVVEADSPNGRRRIAGPQRGDCASHAEELDGRENPPTAISTNGRGKTVPADLLRRVPVRPGPYQRWRRIWDELCAGGRSREDLHEIAHRHDLSVRQLEFIRRAGHAGLLDTQAPPMRPPSHRARIPENHPTT